MLFQRFYQVRADWQRTTHTNTLKHTQTRMRTHKHALHTQTRMRTELKHPVTLSSPASCKNLFTQLPAKLSI